MTIIMQEIDRLLIKMVWIIFGVIICNILFDMLCVVWLLYTIVVL